MTGADARLLERRVLTPLLEGLSRNGPMYRGVLYVGVAWTPEGQTVLELNVRPGNPERIALLARLDQPLDDVLAQCAHERFRGDIRYRDDVVSGCVFMTVSGYPVEARFDGSPVTGLDSVPQDVQVLGEGIRSSADRLVAGEGRSLCLVATAPSIESRRHRLYDAASRVTCPSLHYRRDIGLRRSLVRDPGGRFKTPQPI